MIKIDKKLFASLMLAITTLLWGLTYPIQSISANNLKTYTVVFFKAIGFIGLLPLISIYKQKFNKQTWIAGLYLGICAFVGCVFQQKGLVLSGVSKASFITVLYIVIVPIIGLFLGKKIKRRMLIAIFIALIGLYFLCISGNFSINIGDLYLLMGAFCFALQIILIDYYGQKCDPLPLCATQQFFVSLFSAIMMIFVEKPTLNDFGNSLWPILYLIFLSGVLSTTIQIVYQKDLDPSLASLILSFESVFGAIFGWIILNQSMSIKEIIGCVLVFIAILIAE